MLAGYNYRKSITIGHSDDGAQTNYQLMLTIHRTAGADSGADVYVGTKCLSNYNDIRFTQSDGDTLLDYWIETSDANTATVWIEFNSIPASPGTATFYIYYGNSGASVVSNITDTFIWGDDFSTAWNNPVKWTGDTAKGSVSGGIMTYDSFDVPSSISGNIFSPTSTVALRTRASIGSAYRAAIGMADAGMTKWGFIFEAGSDVTPQQLYTYNNGNANRLSSNWTRDAYKIFDIYFRANINNRMLENGVELTSSPMTLYLPNDALSAQIYADRASDLYGFGKILVDWILLRNWTLNEPTWDAWGAEQKLIGAPNGSLSMMGCGC